jgi:hypothetical protein
LRDKKKHVKEKGKKKKKNGKEDNKSMKREWKVTQILPVSLPIISTYHLSRRNANGRDEERGPGGTDDVNQLRQIAVRVVVVRLSGATSHLAREIEIGFKNENENEKENENEVKLTQKRTRMRRMRPYLRQEQVNAEWGVLVSQAFFDTTASALRQQGDCSYRVICALRKEGV